MVRLGWNFACTKICTFLDLSQIFEALPGFFFAHRVKKKPGRASKILGNLTTRADIGTCKISARSDKRFPQKGPVTTQLELLQANWIDCSLLTYARPIIWFKFCVQAVQRPTGWRIFKIWQWLRLNNVLRSSVSPHNINIHKNRRKQTPFYFVWF